MSGADGCEGCCRLSRGTRGSLNKHVRLLVVAGAGVVLAGLPACGSGGSGSTGHAPTTKSGGVAMEKFDPCGFFRPAELTSWGLSAQGKEFAPVSFEPGCRWQGEQMSLTFQKNVDETVASYEKSGNWERYDKKTIGGRSAAVANVPGGGSTGGCNVLVDAGGGVAIYGVSGRFDDSVDACGEVEKIVGQSASRLPE
ncbi:DUF3558 family protein [Saccharopolyspora elongata]|uniref:DUF3558 domain-containing protein n=1 Tax=Saccharopolyspora elongata TaxID=2530387 RepID=A0A4R4Z6G0_9PSEU|nr:DUF3558 family protein [Saccharopolyspora elongata]TDD53693.1 DUF3558 domain-containing protein [Saccharopolyspora elongata]